MKNLKNKIKHYLFVGLFCFLIAFIISLFVLATDRAFATDICMGRTYLNITASSDCGIVPETCPAVTGCTADPTTPTSVSCIGFVCTYCCPDSMNQQRGDTDGTQIITDVPLGDEQTTAQTGYNTWASSHNYQTSPEGYTMTGTLEGFVYNTAQSDLPGTVDLNLRYWKRGFFTKNGSATITPIENLGTGAASDIVKTGVEGAIDSKLGLYESNASELNTFTGTEANQNSLDNPSGLNSWTGFGPVIEDNMVTKITAFIASNPVLDIFRNSTMTASGASCSFSVEVFNHEVEFSFCPFESHFELLGTMILAMAVLYSLFIALGKG